jgi:ribonuclease BN (tRNA processing enzyme)
VTEITNREKIGGLCYRHPAETVDRHRLLAATQVQGWQRLEAGHRLIAGLGTDGLDGRRRHQHGDALCPRLGLQPGRDIDHVAGRGELNLVAGDTRRCPGLIEAARDCDLLVHEVFAHGVMQPREGVRSAATIRAVEAYHTTATEVGALAAEAGARALLLTHIVPPDVPPERLLADVRAHYAGPVIVGEDLVTVDLATLTVRWRGMVTGLSRL